MPGQLMDAGSRLGPYEIAAPIGVGGMGEVYRAIDTRLSRTVAIKVLPAHLAADAERRQRLDREARIVSSLDHPSICALYDVGHEAGRDFLVMQYLDGETLAARIAKGPLPVDRAISYGAQIASALDAAHRAGIVHRDLKPANVMLTKSGVKVLDFGLARLATRAATGGNIVDALTVTSDGDSPPVTSDGVILGTVPYMAPEQVEGKATDARTDIFAFGARRPIETVRPSGGHPRRSRDGRDCRSPDGRHTSSQSRSCAADLYPDDVPARHHFERAVQPGRTHHRVRGAVGRQTIRRVHDGRREP